MADIVGPYEIESSLSEGAMGAIHRARHREDGTAVALKTVGVTLRKNLHGLRREIRALQAVRHPNVVEILDADVNAAPPWYAMELIEGLSLANHFQVAEAPERWERYLRAFADVCDGLGHIHGAGLVHRDLKPGNVILRSTADSTLGEAVLVDFGLATIAGGGIGREQLYKRSEIAGTPQYISPEQVSQDHVDPRTDLYALGCMLYELVVGRPPFVADVPFVGMLKHVNEAPEIPRSVATAVPRGLVELIYALLEKRPADRPGYASEVRTVLGHLGDVGSADHKPTPRPYLHRPEFVGRDEMLERFDRIAGEFSHGNGNLVVVEGAAGAGKSRVAIELIRRMHVVTDDRLEVLLSESPKTETRAPLASLRRALEEIADVCLERGERYTAATLGPQGALLARHVPALAAVPGVPQTSLPEEKPELVEQTTLEAVTGVFVRITRDRPLVVAMDDVQWADPLTRRWLEFAGEQRPWDQHPFVLVVVSREGAGPVLGALKRTTGVALFEVGPLDAPSVAAMVESMTATDDVPAEFLDALVSESRGLPSHVARWLAAAVGRGALVRSGGVWRFDGGDTKPDTLPTEVSFEDLVAETLKTLPSESRALLQLAAILGPELREDVLLHLSDAETAIVDAMVSDGILVDAGRGAVRFASAEIHELVSNTLEERPRKELHVRAAALLEAVGAPTVEIVHHLARSGWRDEARERLWREAEGTFANGDWLEAEQLLDTLVDLGFRTTEHEAIGRARLSSIIVRRGAHDEARAELERARTAFRDVDDAPVARAELARCEGILRKTSGAIEEAVAAFESARRQFAELGNWPLERKSMVDLAACHYRNGDFDRAREVYMAVHDRAREADDDLGVASALAGIGLTLINARRYDAAVDFLSRARDRLAPEHLHRRANVSHNLGACHVDRGDFEEAEEAFRETIDLCQRCGNTRAAALARSSLGHALQSIGRIDEAIDQLEGAVEDLEFVGDRYGLATAHQYLGEALGQRKEIDEAMDHFVQSLTLHRDLPYSEHAQYVYLEMAKLHRRLGLYADARHYLDRADDHDGHDEYFRVSRQLAQARLDLAEGGETDVVPEELRAALRSMQLPPTSALYVDVDRFEDSVRREDLIHGERPEDVPDAFIGNRSETPTNQHTEHGEE